MNGFILYTLGSKQRDLGGLMVFQVPDCIDGAASTLIYHKVLKCSLLSPIVILTSLLLCITTS